MNRLPPVRVVRTATAVRTALQGLTRRMAPPEIALLELSSGFMATHAVHAAARLGVADALAGGARSAREVAAELGLSADGIARLLRACAAFGLFREDSEGRFALTPMGGALRSDAPKSMRPVILMLGHPSYQAVWGQLPHAVTSGLPGAVDGLGAPFWDVLEQGDEFPGVFHEAMARLAALDWPTVEAVYDFTPFSTIVDIGGGHGELLARMLGAAPLAKGVLLERSGAIARAEQHLREAGVLDRCRLEDGSFFESVPAGGDLYVLRRIVHDWGDDEAVALLSTVRRNMPAEATLLLMESVVPPGNEPHFAKSLDLDMLLFVGGRERTEREFTTLLDRAGFRLGRIIPTISPITLLEAVPR
ncbi:hypothetical protein N802_18505 [Knoellia sinensis KCTC 19936]|uniref:O-methyltransferase n=1 Tax=Knoellia sinensis KCTC 19936 TaxID=1385520 RepID=A0A0A0J8H1_9MICO|nr:methyltransferase [Knoellia sinensis]KGN32357.1 hypothetical protein N802_18505 [Knoellia sinensis KCTC 19936]